MAEGGQDLAAEANRVGAGVNQELRQGTEPGRVLQIDEHLEFFSVVVPDGAFTSRLSKLREGDEIFVERAGMEQFVERWEQHPTLASLRPFAAQLRPERLAHRPAGLASALRHLGAGAQPSYWDDLRTLRAPVRLIAGAQDAKFAALARRMHELLPRAELILIPDCGHAPHLERPQAFVEALR